MTAQNTLNPLIRKAREEGWAEWIATPNDERAVLDGCRIETTRGPDDAVIVTRAQYVRDFFEKFLRLSKGQWAGKPFTLFDWQWHDIVVPLFGWVRPDGTRRFRLGYLSTAKKNFKSTFGSGLALYLLVADGEQGAEVYGAASDRLQASIIFNESANMVRASKKLSAILIVRDSTKHIAHPKTNSYYRAISADAHRNEGLNASAVLFDELHAQPTRKLWDTLRYAGAVRRQPLQLSFTTAGFDRESICREQYDYAQGVLTGTVPDTSFFPFIREATADDDWTDPQTWAKANPSLGLTVKSEDIANELEEARRSPAKENSFRRYRLNQWTQQADRFLPMEAWDACVGTTNPADLEGKPCFGGLDLSSTRDVSAFVLVFPDAETTTTNYDVLSFFWVPEANCEAREARDRVSYRVWAKDGLVTLTPGEAVDYDVIRRDIKALGERFNIRDIAVDRWNATQLMGQLAGDGFDIVPFGQGYASMSAPTKALEMFILGGQIRHGGNPMLRWMCDNLAVEHDAADNIKPSKKVSTERIDGMVALIMAIGRATANPDISSSYDEHGLVFV